MDPLGEELGFVLTAFVVPEDGALLGYIVESGFLDGSMESNELWLGTSEGKALEVGIPLGSALGEMLELRSLLGAKLGLWMDSYDEREVAEPLELLEENPVGESLELLVRLRVGELLEGLVRLPAGELLGLRLSEGNSVGTELYDPLGIPLRKIDGLEDGKLDRVEIGCNLLGLLEGSLVG